MLSAAVEDVYVDPLLKRWIVDLVRATRTLDIVEVGASVRGSLALERAARAWALLHGRSFASPEDVETLFVPVHRPPPPARARARGRGGHLDASEAVARVFAACARTRPAPEPDWDAEARAADVSAWRAALPACARAGSSPGCSSGGAAARAAATVTRSRALGRTGPATSPRTSTGRHRHGSRRRAAPTSSSSASSSPSRLRASPSSSIAGRGWPSTRRRRRGSTSAPRPKTAVRLIAAARPRSTASSFTRTRRSHGRFPGRPGSRGRRGALRRAAGALRSARALERLLPPCLAAADRQLRVRRVGLPRAGAGARLASAPCAALGRDPGHRAGPCVGAELPAVGGVAAAARRPGDGPCRGRLAHAARGARARCRRTSGVSATLLARFRNLAFDPVLVDSSDEDEISAGPSVHVVGDCAGAGSLRGARDARRSTLSRRSRGSVGLGDPFVYVVEARGHGARPGHRRRGAVRRRGGAAGRSRSRAAASRSCA